jgi:hypothetical protein
MFWFLLCILPVCSGGPFSLFIKFSTYKKEEAYDHVNWSSSPISWGVLDLALNGGNGYLESL